MSSLKPAALDAAKLLHWTGSRIKVPPPLAVPQLLFALCASSARAWRLWAARYSQGEAQPLGVQPPPRGLKRAASKFADFNAFDHLGAGGHARR